MPSATARGGDGRCLSKRALRNPVRADGRLARQLGLAGSVAVVTHCGSVVPPGRRRGWPQRAGGRCFPSLLAYTELPVRRWPPAGARPRAHRCWRRGAQPPGDPRGATPDCTDHASRRYRQALREAGCRHAGGVPRWRRRGSVAALTASVMVDAAVFDRRRSPLTVWLTACWMFASQKGGVSALSLQRSLEIGSYPTAWAMLHRLRWVLVRPGRDRLTGTVEVDETYIGGEEPGLRGG